MDRTSFLCSTSVVLLVIVSTAIPPGLSLTQVPNMNVDLSVTSAQLQCTTSGCTYPSPLIQWLVQGQSASSPYEVFKTLNPTGTVCPCVSPEQFYTSTLDLQQNTTLSDNSDKIFIFSCRIEYEDSSMNLITSGSQTIRFARNIRPAANIDWYIGSQKRGNGTSLNFIPTNEDHDKAIYCRVTT